MTTVLDLETAPHNANGRSADARVVHAALARGDGEDGTPYTRFRAEQNLAPQTIETIGVADIFAPLAPIAWCIEGLALAPGAAACFAGYGFVGKTLTAQDIATSKASGRDVFGVFRTKPGRVLHLDFEQGRRLTCERYQRLAIGKGIEAGELEDRLRLAVMPSVYLDSPTAASVYSKAIDGFDLVIVDSLRAAAPSAEENSSEIRRYIDVLTRASEATGALCIFLHHARKPNDGQSGGAKMSLRGSSAIYDAAASVFVLSAEKGQPARVQHEKCRIRGITIPDFGLEIQDVAVGNDPRAGLRLVHLDREQLEPAEERHSQFDAAAGRVRAELRNHPRGVGKNQLRELVRIRKETLLGVLEKLDADGETENVGTPKRPLLRLCAAPPKETP
jgi:hypothetical protein